ncbi:MAG: dockerin type I repeat-containing protein [Clostridia bacterium]|nr:dockerin type I repeat-containing protein [Clostridia bacterium]
MKKLLSIILSVLLLISSVSVISFASDTEESGETTASVNEETEPSSEEATEGKEEITTGEEAEPEETTNNEETTAEEETTVKEDDPFDKVKAHLMCDANNDGEVKADDARLILRCSVALDAIEPQYLPYADTDFNGKITAADARIALRTAVELEEKISRKFIITYEKAASCTEEGYVKAKCNEPEKEISVTISKLQHNVSDLIHCMGLDTCTRCNQIIEVPIQHLFKVDKCNGKQVCSRCNFTETIEISHTIKNGMCTECGFMPDNAYYKSIADYVKKNGKYEKGVYYCDGTDEFAAYALCYEVKSDSLYILCSTGVGIGSSVVLYDCYIDIPKEFREPYADYNVELYCHSSDILAAKAKYWLSPYDLDGTREALFEDSYESIPELQGKMGDFKTIAESLCFAAVDWVLRYGKENNVKGLNYYNLGFTLMK